MFNEEKTKDLIDLFYENEKPIKRSAIEKLLDEGANIDGINNEFPLFYAVNNNNYEIVEFLLEKGADVRKRSNHINDNFTSLHVACANGNADIVKLLIQYGADIVKKELYGNTPLMIATLNENVEIVETLLDTRTYTLALSSAASSSASSSASSASASHSKSVKKIMDLIYSTINIENDSGYTPLNAACQNQNQFFIELFINLGANMSHPIENGDKPIHQLIIKNRPDLIDILIDRGADVNDINTRTGYTPLMLACGCQPPYPPRIRIIIMLLNTENINMNIRSRNGETALEILRRVHPGMAAYVDEYLSVYNTAMVSLMLDPENPNPMFSKIDAEATENIKQFMFKRDNHGGKKSKRRKSKKRQYTKRSRK
jgi:ankyrin repeat protein